MTSPKQISNPILKGFNPDPSIIRVGDDFYIATSTFEWFPGVQVHHSRDLRNWRLVGQILYKRSQLDMKGLPDSCGVWAPCLSYDQGKFYLVYSVVRSFDGVWKDTPNYLVWSDSIEGPWSEPVFLSASGFDGSLFHDKDGKKWYVSMLVDHRRGRFFGGIIMQQFDETQAKLLGPTYYLSEGTDLGCTEGPHLYQKDGYYYLILAEGGTEYGHAITLMRSRDISGPYEVHPHNPLLSSRENPQLPLQKAGHGDLVQTADGDWYLVFLVGRPLSERGRCIKGRETAIQKLIWEEGEWPRLAQGGNAPQMFTPAPNLKDYAFWGEKERAYFATDGISPHFQSLRVPIEESWLSLIERPGYLRLKGRDSLSSYHQQSLLARRVQADSIRVSTALEFYPETFQQMAGLVCYYNTAHFHYLYLAGHSPEKKGLQILTNDKYQFVEAMSEPILLDMHTKVYLRARMEGAGLQFYYSLDTIHWEPVGPVLDASILSDDYAQFEAGRYRPAFTGAFVGMCCQDLSGNFFPADFEWFEYKELNTNEKTN